ncbi:helix-turn-helix domain-containing protein [Aquabacterium sp. A7-Y]|uniref:helix-turn-helix transcriptional regulator n=1 Tax=Aquabacterium sp. A7-Y TaxID=1349605 RepID=UPI00223D517F|nr:helix-turn-helix transcriptional regulator [Aquabacterium sp. A7-Y]MCW7538861.1 helix-turn-helix domain-containing protein [Aquabacterium sp. A7-Y]
MPARSELSSSLEQQLLVQLGERLRRARKSRSLSAVELARQVGISRTTLSAVEQGDPSPAFGTYVRVLSALGMVADLALVATSKAASASADEPVVPTSLHRAQDLQSLLMHQEAVRLLRKDPTLVARLEQTLSRWSTRDDPNSRPLLQRWADIVAAQDWNLAIADTEEARQLRQASPLATLLPDETRQAIIREVKALKERARAAA